MKRLKRAAEAEEAKHAAAVAAAKAQQVSASLVRAANIDHPATQWPESPRGLRKSREKDAVRARAAAEKRAAEAAELERAGAERAATGEGEAAAVEAHPPAAEDGHQPDAGGTAPPLSPAFPPAVFSGAVTAPCGGAAYRSGFDESADAVEPEARGAWYSNYLSSQSPLMALVEQQHKIGAGASAAHVLGSTRRASTKTFLKKQNRSR